MSLTQDRFGQATGKGFVDSLNVAVRENPVAASLIGMGALWMLFGGARVPSFGAKLNNAARSVAGAVGDAGEATAGGLSSAASQVANAAHHVGESISSGIQGAGTIVKDAMATGYNAASDLSSGSLGEMAGTTGRASQPAVHSEMNFGTSLRKNLSETLDHQPLLLGAIGFAIGAGIASAFPSTTIEKDFMGEAGAAVKEKMQEFASETKEAAQTKGKQILDDVKREAAAQGLTPSAATDALKSVGEKAKVVAGSASQSIRSRLS